MGTSERKQRERAEREKLIIDVGRKMLVKHGYHGLNMDRIAEEIEYSKGIVYQHFASKDDLLCGISIDLLQEGLSLIRRASEFPGSPRERMTAVVVASHLLFRLHPDGFQAQLIIWISSIAEKTPSARQETLCRLQDELHSLLHEIVDDAVRRQNLRLPPGFDPHYLVHGMWALLVGTELTVQAPRCTPHALVLDPHASVWNNIQRLWDGFGWKPLSTECDYQATKSRILAEVFPAEYATMQKNGRGL